MSTPERGQPRIQYKRTYVLIPQDHDAAWAKAVIDASWDEHRYTVGSSADDAGIGDLDARNVIAVNPASWGGSLADFFETHYAGVEIRVIEAATPEVLVE